MIWLRVLWVAIGYGLFLFLVQCRWINGLEYPGLRVDLLLPLALQVSLELPLVAALTWCLGWGFVLDTFSGRLWGLHVVTYLLVVALVALASDRFELRNRLYRLLCVTVCALCQGIVFGVYGVIASAAPPYDPVIWVPLLVRTAAIMVLSPLVSLPFEKYAEQFRGS